MTVAMDLRDSGSAASLSALVTLHAYVHAGLFAAAQRNMHAIGVV